MRFAAAIVALYLAAAPAAAYYENDHSYTLDFELDSKTGKYRPAYTYKTTKGGSTIWLDGANRKPAKTATPNSAKAPTDYLFVKFDGPKGWNIDRNAERVLVTNADGTKFTIFASRAAKDTDKFADFADEWKTFVPKEFGALPKDEIQTGRMQTGGEFLLAAKARAQGIALAVVRMESRAITMRFEFPSETEFQKHRGTFRSFLNSLQIKKGSLAKPK